jgi:acyl carrier protein
VVSPKPVPRKSWIFIINSITITPMSQLKPVKAILGHRKYRRALETPNETSKTTIRRGIDSLSATDLLVAFSKAYSQLISIPRIVKNMLIYLKFNISFL